MSPDELKRIRECAPFTVIADRRRAAVIIEDRRTQGYHERSLLALAIGHLLEETVGRDGDEL